MPKTIHPYEQPLKVLEPHVAITSRTTRLTNSMPPTYPRPTHQTREFHVANKLVNHTSILQLNAANKLRTTRLACSSLLRADDVWMPRRLALRNQPNSEPSGVRNIDVYICHNLLCKRNSINVTDDKLEHAHGQHPNSTPTGWQRHYCEPTIETPRVSTTSSNHMPPYPGNVWGYRKCSRERRTRNTLRQGIGIK